VGTANFVNPRATVDVIRGLERFLAEQSVGDINELIGKVHAG
jgi:dihydroorotate dehydrogenase (NAD+) catalytic subunit